MKAGQIKRGVWHPILSVRRSPPSLATASSLAAFYTLGCLHNPKIDPAPAANSAPREFRRKAAVLQFEVESTALDAKGKTRPRALPVDRKLRLHWPPEAISGRLAIDYPDRPDMRISHERIYQWIEADSRVQGRLHHYLRRRHKYRRRRRRLSQPKSRLTARLDIEQRPAVVDRRARYGDWEGDTVWGKNNTGAIATHVERKSGYLVAFKLRSRHSEPLADATIAAFQKLPRRWRHTLTYDNGTEFSAFARIAQSTGLTVYFAKPHSPWQRGCNENLNGLLRQFFRKGSALSQVEQSDVDKVVALLNHRPRKRLNYLTPHEVLKQGRPVAVGS